MTGDQEKYHELLGTHHANPNSRTHRWDKPLGGLTTQGSEWFTTRVMIQVDQESGDV